MTIERPDLRRDNHDLLKRVMEVWQEIEQSSMMPKVKLVRTFPVPLFLSYPHWRRMGNKCEKREDEQRRKKAEEEKED
jgi:hypothetical protein